MLADTPEELEEKKILFNSWVMNVFQEKLHDPFILDYHFLATFEDIDFEDDESMLKTRITVVFSAYPYKIANKPKEYSFDVTTTAQTIRILNESQ